MERLIDKGCKIITEAKVISSKDGTITYEKNGSTFEINNINTVVSAIGLKSNVELKEVLDRLAIKYHIIGDANKPHRITSAMMSAQLLGEEL